MVSTRIIGSGFAALLLAVFALPAAAQSFRVQCPTSTALHPLVNSSGQTGQPDSTLPNPHIKCQQLSGGDGFATMADGTQEYMFSFGPLSGLGNIVHGMPGTVTAAEFNQSNVDGAGNVLDAVKIGAPDGLGYTFNGAIGLAPDVNNVQQVLSVDVIPGAGGTGYVVNDAVTFAGGGTPTSAATGHVGSVDAAGAVVTVVLDYAGTGYTARPNAFVTSAAGLGANFTVAMELSTGDEGHVDPRLIMDVGVMNGNIPAPMIAIDEGDELFLTLTNVGQIMRPDLFEQHTVHFHGYANASSFFDGVPDASVAINIGGSFTYYYLAPEAGTYMWHCHISPPEHLQMGMVGQLYVRPKQDSATGPLRAALQSANAVSATSGTGERCNDILCAEQTPLPAIDTGAIPAAGVKYAYNDGDGSTAYEVAYPIQMHGFDPNFHFVGMTFNPESFVDNKDKFFLLNGRSYPDTITRAPLSTQATDGTPHFSQPLNSIIDIPAGQRALLRISDLNVTEFHTLASLGIPMHVVGLNARLLRDLDGNNMDYYTNSITLGGGETIDVILDSCQVRAIDGTCTTAYPTGTYYLYTPQLDHLSNDAENFGGMMTEVRIN